VGSADGSAAALGVRGALLPHISHDSSCRACPTSAPVRPA